MRLRLRLLPVCLLALTVTFQARQASLGPAERIADGVQLYRIHDKDLLTPPGPVAVQALRLDPQEITLEIVRAQGEDIPVETVPSIAARRPGTIAAINAGFFSLQTGRPTDFLKVDGEVITGTNRPRAAVGIIDDGETASLIFDRVTVSTGKQPPTYTTLLGTSPRDWAKTADAISGAGLLMVNGRDITDWTVERIAAGFETTRHPRTIIGTDTDGHIWLVTVDGRNPAVSLGMSFTELQRLARRLGLRSVMNLDGGGSTTMWVNGKVVNHPSDAGGLRRVSDAILVRPRGR
ncbi:MAG TPA: phosphodiester glycosidase family protein [Vicinamibacterales bacterium]